MLLYVPPLGNAWANVMLADIDADVGLFAGPCYAVCNCCWVIMYKSETNYQQQEGVLEWADRSTEYWMDGCERNMETRQMQLFGCMALLVCTSSSPLAWLYNTNYSVLDSLKAVGC
jgi:hypothetical protein